MPPKNEAVTIVNKNKRIQNVVKESLGQEQVNSTTFLTIVGLMMIMRLDWVDQVAMGAWKKASIFFFLVLLLQYNCSE